MSQFEVWSPLLALSKARPGSAWLPFSGSGMALVLAGRTQGRAAEVSGGLVVTSIELVAPLVLPVLRRSQEAHPDTLVSYKASPRIYRLEYGEDHVALRLGPKPEHPDDLVQPWFTLRSALYAHRRYVARRGLPKSLDAPVGRPRRRRPSSPPPPSSTPESRPTSRTLSP